MAQLRKKALYEITVDNIAPPYEDYEFFKDCDQLPFRHQAKIFDMVNAWWLIEAAILVYSAPEFVTEKGLTEVLIEPMVDHVPTIYAIHIWNNILEVG